MHDVPQFLSKLQLTFNRHVANLFKGRDNKARLVFTHDFTVMHR